MKFLRELGIKKENFGVSTGEKWNSTRDNGKLDIVSPATGEFIASVYLAADKDYEHLIKKAQKGYEYWRQIPAPKRGDIVRQIGLKLRKKKKHSAL